MSYETSDALMTQPLLGAMYLGGDWRQGQNLVWFFDIGSRAPALAGLMFLLFLLLKPDPGWGRYVSAGAVSAVVTALNPLVGLAAIGTLAGASVLARASWRWIGLTAACLMGAFAAAPTYWQIFLRAGAKPTLHQMPALAVAVVLANFLILLPLAILGGKKSGRPLAAIAIAGVVLLVVTAAVRLPEGNEHNLRTPRNACWQFQRQRW